MIDLVSTFIVFFSIIDPIGTVPVFVAVTSQEDAAAKRRIAFVAAGASAGVLLFFVVAGEFVLTAMKIPLPAFQIAGGLVLFMFALSMIFGESKPDEEVRLASERSDLAIYPLAVPSIAGPGAILTAVLMTENARFSIWEQTQTALTMLAVVLVAYLLMLVSGPIQRKLGRSGASVVSRIMGLILASAATANTLSGIKEYFGH